jgi:hypothetical protein
MEMTGRVVRQELAGGSKSEHHGVVLETEGGSFVLRREEGNPFRDEALDALVGQRIRARGFTAGRTLVMSGWERVDEEGSARWEVGGGGAQASGTSL